jgi:hypothetical protein
VTPDEARLAGRDYVGQILKGAIPADLPLPESTGVELVLNLKTANRTSLHEKTLSFIMFGSM